MADVADIAALHHQRNVVVNFMADMFEQPVITEISIAFVLLHSDFHHFQQVKHGDIVQSVGFARNGEFHAADHRVIARVFQRHAAVQERRHHHFVIENLRNTGAQTDGFCRLEQEGSVDKLIHPHAEVRLGKLDALIRIETQK
ncbi:hypothetical protein D3C71_682650 [compost metagenome]